MHISATNRLFLKMLQDIHDVSEACATATYIWGGLTTDLLEGRFLREHRDLDGFTRDLLDVLPQMMGLYAERNYEVKFRDDLHILVIRRDGLHAAFNRLEVEGDIAMWRHIGERGTVYFPASWLQAAGTPFYGVPVRSAGAELDYALKANVRLLSPEWLPREKDIQAMAYLEAYLAQRGIAAHDVLDKVWSHNPFWAERGYSEYEGPARRQ